ncbi:MAG: thioredoxin family protein [Stenotrophomonas sp.]
MKLRSGAISLLLGVVLAGCSQPPAPAPEKAQPLDTTEQKMPVADVSQPVASGNTPAAADIAAVAALNAQFDPARDPAADLETAKVEAQRGGKRIMLDVGSEECAWCHLLDAFMEGDSEMRRFRDAHYVWVKVNYSKDNENVAFLSRFPAITGYPHLFVLDANGALLHSQLTDELENGKGYDRARFFAFLKQWAPPATP